MFRIRAEEIRVGEGPRKDSVRWMIVPKVGFHNHDFITFKDGHRHFAALDDDAKQFLREGVGANISPKDMKNALHKRTPDKAQPSSSQIYSETNKIRKEGKEGRNPAQQLFNKAVESNYVEWHETVPGVEPNTEVLTHLFMAHPEGVKLFRSYHHVVLIDSTYNTNPYKACLVQLVGVTPTGNTFLIAYAILPSEDAEDYSWMLRKLGELLAPNVGAFISTFVTDRELGLISAIEAVYPGTPHLLCRWHLNRAIEKKILESTYMRIHRSDIVQNREGSWFRVLYSNNAADFAANWASFSTKWPNLAQYVSSTWGKYSRKFVLYFVNKAFHLGNTATSRAESSHSLLKSWIKCANLNLDNMWGRIDDMLVAQHSKIKHELQKSISRPVRGGSPLFVLLHGKVSIKAIDILETELKRGIQLKDVVNDRCGCVLVRTHGLPCACFMVRLLTNGRLVQVEHINVFWRTLDYGKDQHKWATNDDVLDELMAEAKATDGSKKARVIENLRGTLHPEDKTILPPVVRENPKGRPKGSTKRDPCGFEHAKRRTARKSTPRTPHIHTHVVGDFPAGVAGAPLEIGYTKGLISSWVHRDGVPRAMWPYFDGWVDVVPDGHCGYRVMSHASTGVESNYLGMRKILAAEFNNDPRYLPFLGTTVSVNSGLTGFQRILKRIEFSGTGGCGEEHWLGGDDFYGFATYFNWTICVIGINSYRGATGFSCYTYPPLRNRGSGPFGVLWVVNHRQHWMRLHATDALGVVPMPRLDFAWQDLRDDSVAHYRELYQENFDLWRKLDFEVMPYYD